MLIKQFLLLVDKFTYIPVPRKAIADEEYLPQALRFLPLLGFAIGGMLFGASKMLAVMPPLGAAAALLGLNIFLGGAIVMRDLITIADGLATDPLYAPDSEKQAAKQNPLNIKELREKSWRFNAGRAGLIWGLVWLLAIYFLYLWYFVSANISNIALITAPVVCRFLMSWLIYYFYAVPPAWLHRNFKRPDFVLAGVLTLACILPFSRPALYLGTLVSCLGVYIFGTYRERAIGGLDDACYGAACAWAEVLFLLGWMLSSYLF